MNTPLTLPPGCPFDPEGLRKLIERLPPHRAVGTRLVEVGPRSVTLAVDWRADLVADPAAQTLAGGVMSTLVDQACGFAMLMHLGGERSSGGTVELHQDFIAPLQQGRTLRVHGECVASDEQAAWMRCTGYDSQAPEHPLLTASAVFMIDNTPLVIGPPKPSGTGPEPAASQARWDTPYFDFLGLREQGPGELVLPAEFRHLGNRVRKSLHGGVLAAFLECAGLHHLRGLGLQQPRTLTMGMQFLRFARMHDTHARVSVVRQGRRIATLRVEAWQHDEDQPVAVGNGQFLLSPDVSFEKQ